MKKTPMLDFFINMQKLDVNLELNRKRILMIITEMIDCQCDLPRNHVHLSLHKLLRTIAFFCSWVDDFLVSSNKPQNIFKLTNHLEATMTTKQTYPWVVQG